MILRLFRFPPHLNPVENNEKIFLYYVVLFLHAEAMPGQMNAGHRCAVIPRGWSTEARAEG